MKRRVKVYIITLLAIVVIINIGVYFSLVNKFIKTKSELRESRAQIIKEILEKQNMQDELKIRLEQLQNLQAELENTKNELSLANKRLGSLEKINLALVEEKENLQTKLHSLKELKNAIRLVKLQIHKQKVERYLANKKMQQEIDARELVRGNRGYLVKDGRSLSLAWLNFKIEVKPPINLLTS